MSWLSQLFHPGGAYDTAASASKQGYEEGKGLRQPYIDKGGEAGNDLMEQLKKLFNPGGLQDEWSNNYETSASGKQDIANAQAQGLDTASSMGLGGSSTALNNIQQTTSDIGQKDKQQYMKDLMEKYLSGIGLGTNIFNTGAATANAGAGSAEGQGDTQAGLNFGKYNAGPNMITGGLGAIMKFIEAMNNNSNPGGVPAGGAK